MFSVFKTSEVLCAVFYYGSWQCFRGGQTNFLMSCCFLAVQPRIRLELSPDFRVSAVQGRGPTLLVWITIFIHRYIYWGVLQLLGFFCVGSVYQPYGSVLIEYPLLCCLWFLLCLLLAVFVGMQYFPPNCKYCIISGTGLCYVMMTSSKFFFIVAFLLIFNT